jgi:anaerobic selenocysteine-containing dehydrogenase
VSAQAITIAGMTVHLTHWGAFEAVSDGERLTEVRPWRGDPEPMPLIGNVASAQHHPARIAVPHVRKGWLDHGPGAPGRGDDPFVPVTWDMALDLLAGELRRVYRDHGAEAVYAGSVAHDGVDSGMDIERALRTIKIVLFEFVASLGIKLVQQISFGHMLLSRRGMVHRQSLPL